METVESNRYEDSREANSPTNQVYSLGERRLMITGEVACSLHVLRTGKLQEVKRTNLTERNEDKKQAKAG